MQKQKIKVPFTRFQYTRVQEFLKFIRSSGMAHQDLGNPIQVTVQWTHGLSEEEEKEPSVILMGPMGRKAILIKDILEADDSKLVGPTA